MVRPGSVVVGLCMIFPPANARPYYVTVMPSSGQLQLISSRVPLDKSNSCLRYLMGEALLLPG